MNKYHYHPKPKAAPPPPRPKLAKSKNLTEPEYPCPKCNRPMRLSLFGKRRVLLCDNCHVGAPGTTPDAAYQNLKELLKDKNSS